MVDSVAVFPAGYRLTDSNTGAPLSGARIRFFDASPGDELTTTDPKIVYANQGLTIELGTYVVCDALGYPTSNGSTKTLIYVGTQSYKIRIETSTGVEIVTHDHVPGAVVSDDSASSAAVTALFPVVTKSLDYTVVADDQNKLFAINCSGGDVVLTLPSASLMGNGWGILVQHAGSANQAILATASPSQKIYEGSKDFGTTFALALNGEECHLISDGGNWRVTSHTTPFPKVSPIPVIDRVTSAPVSPVEGGFYLVTSAYSTFSTHDIIQYTDNGYVAFTPYTDCGWLAYVQDEDTTYQFQGTAWAVFPIPATTSVAGISRLADAAAMEAKTSSRTVTADVQHRHPAHAKAWGYVTYSGGTPTLAASEGVSGITDDATGTLTVTLSTAMSSTNYCVVPGCNDNGSGNGIARHRTLSTGSFVIEVRTTGGGSLTDPIAVSFVVFGDQ